MWRRGTVAGLAALCVVVGGCSSPDSDPADESTEASAEPRTDELFVGECGSMTEEQLTQITGIRGLGSTSKNAVSCRWDSIETGSYTMFTWYRGSPIDRERAVAGQIGREIASIEADGHPGFTARGGAGDTATSCEAGVESGDGFLHWSVNYAFSVPPRDVCDIAEALAQATVENAR